jgi:carboxymethylenebutenolidase
VFGLVQSEFENNGGAIIMKFKTEYAKQRRTLMGLAIAALALSYGALFAYSQQKPATQAEVEAARSKQQDNIIKADIPYANDGWRSENLSQSPRRHEMVKLPGEVRQAFVVYPTAEKAPVVVMMPEDQGLNNWSKEMADVIAAMGAIVIVPDWLSGRGPNGGGRESFPDAKSALMANFPVTREMTTADQNAWADWGEKLPQFNGKLAVLGFGWGAGRAFWFATQRKDLAAAFIFYDWAPPEEALAGIVAPVYGFYAEKDTRVERTLEATKASMAKLGKKYEAIDYPDSEHMFVRLGQMAADKNPANIYARNDSLARLQQLLKTLK